METEAELVSRSLGGDRDAFARLVTLHQAVALRVAYAIVAMDAEDVVQDAFVKAFTRLGQFRSGGSFRAWFLAIVTNESRNRRRGSGRHGAVILRVAARREDPSIDPAAEAARSDSRDRLVGAVSALNDRDREVVALRYFAELTEAETAEVLGCAVGTVKSRLHRALERLRVELADEVLT